MNVTHEIWTTDSPSEPLLSEAAFAIMQRDDFNAPLAFQKVLSGFSINKGDRGEFVALLIITLARDAAVREKNGPLMWTGMIKLEKDWERVISVEEFLRQLFFIDENSMEDVKKIFEDFNGSKMHFNHFIKIHEAAVINVGRLSKLNLRGAAVLGADRQPGIDIAIPIHNGASPPGVALFQIKNDGNFGAEPNKTVFDAMNPVTLGIGEYNVVLRIVFALASKESRLHITTRTVKTKGKQFVAHDIWCAGLSPNNLRPVTTGTEHIWRSLCEESSHWKNVFKEDGVEVRSRMRMKPGSANNDAFWSSWCTIDSV